MTTPGEDRVARFFPVVSTAVTFLGAVVVTTVLLEEARRRIG